MPREPKRPGRPKIKEGGKAPRCTNCGEPIRGHTGTPDCPINKAKKKRYDPHTRIYQPWQTEDGQRSRRMAFERESSRFEEVPEGNERAEQAVDNANANAIQYAPPLLTDFSQAVDNPDVNPGRYTPPLLTDFAQPAESIFHGTPAVSTFDGGTALPSLAPVDENAQSAVMSNPEYSAQGMNLPPNQLHLYGLGDDDSRDYRMIAGPFDNIAFGGQPIENYSEIRSTIASGSQLDSTRPMPPPAAIYYGSPGSHHNPSRYIVDPSPSVGRSRMEVPPTDYIGPRMSSSQPNDPTGLMGVPPANFEFAASGSQLMPNRRTEVNAGPSSRTIYDPESTMQPQMLRLSYFTPPSSPAGNGSMLTNYELADPSTSHVTDAMEGPSRVWNNFSLSRPRGPMRRDLSSTHSVISQFNPGDQSQIPQAGFSGMYGYDDSNVSASNDFSNRDGQPENDPQF